MACFLLLVTCAESYSLNPELDSLRLALSKATNDSIKADILNEIAFKLHVSDPDSSIRTALISQQIAEDIGYEYGIANALMKRGIVNTFLGNYYLALELILNANEKYKAIDDQSGIAASLINMGNIHHRLMDYDKALTNYKRAAQMFSSLGEKTKEYKTRNNIGYIYKVQARYDSALYYLYPIIHSTRSKEVEGVHYPLYNIGSTYVYTNQLDSARKYLQSALAIADSLNDQYVISLSKIDLGKLEMLENNFKEAEKLFTEAKKTAQDFGLKKEYAESTKNLSFAYGKMNNHARAFIEHREFKQVSDSLFSIEKTKSLALLEAEFNFKKERIEVENKERQLRLQQEKELASALLIRNSFIIGFIFMIIISILLYQNYARKRKANIQLNELNLKIKQQADMLDASNREILMINNDLEQEVERRTQKIKSQSEKLKQYLFSNSHIVRAPLSRIMALALLYQNGIENDSEIDSDYILNQVYKSSLELDEVIRDLNKYLSNEEPKQDDP